MTTLIFSFLLSWFIKIHLVGRKTALEEVAEGEMDDVNRINDTATPEENKSLMNINIGKMLQERQCTVQWIQFKFLYVYL